MRVRRGRDVVVAVGRKHRGRRRRREVRVRGRGRVGRRDEGEAVDVEAASGEQSRGHTGLDTLSLVAPPARDGRW